MQCMGLAELTILLCFHTFRMSFLILRCIVVTLLALCTFQCDSCTHNLHLALFCFYFHAYKKKSRFIRPISIPRVYLKIKQNILQTYQTDQTYQTFNLSITIIQNKVTPFLFLHFFHYRHN